MIQFFRRIRQNLIAQGNTAKYLKYAIGEIVLVVIGILIALQINDWNEVRKSRIQERLLLESLQSEFQNNKKVFDSVFKYHERREEFVRRLIAFKDKPIPFKELDSILEIITYNYTINLSGTIYKSSVSSGKIELIRNSKLKNRIASFDDLLADFKEEELAAQEMTNTQILPFMNDNIDIRYPFGARSEQELEKDKIEYPRLVKNIKFRNRLINLKSLCWDITTEGKTVSIEIGRILDEIKTVLGDK